MKKVVVGVTVKVVPPIGKQNCFTLGVREKKSMLLALLTYEFMRILEGRIPFYEPPCADPSAISCKCQKKRLGSQTRSNLSYVCERFELRFLMRMRKFYYYAKFTLQ